MKAERYQGWEDALGRRDRRRATLASLAERVESGEINPEPQSPDGKSFTRTSSATRYGNDDLRPDSALLRVL